MSTKAKTKGRRMPPAAIENGDDALIAAGGGALLGSILGNLVQYAENRWLQGDVQSLHRNMAALRNVIRDWQQSYRSLDAQLAQALSVNQELNRQIGELRHRVREVQGRANAAEQRALAAELALDRLRAEAANGPNHDDSTRGAPERNTGGGR